MHGLFFYIGLGAGLAAACGLRPFLPVLLTGAFGSAKVLGIAFPAGSWHFLQAGWWLLAAAVVFALSYLAQILLGLSPIIDPVSREPRRDPLAAALTGLAFGAGAVLFGGVLAAHHDASWPGVLAALAIVALAQRVAGPVIVGARSRLAEKGPRDALTLYLDSAALVVAALVALLHPLGYVVVAGLLWLALRQRSRSGEKYAGLRILGR
jgi:MFS family permease